MRIVAFLIEHFDNIQNCPDNSDLSIMLEFAGFNDGEIDALLLFISLLNSIPTESQTAWTETNALRIYTLDELYALPTEVRSLLYFLETEHSITPQQREFVIHALMHLSSDEITLENAKTLVVLVLWAQRCELPVLIGRDLAIALHDNRIMH